MRDNGGMTEQIQFKAVVVNANNHFRQMEDAIVRRSELAHKHALEIGALDREIATFRNKVSSMLSIAASDE